MRPTTRNIRGFTGVEILMVLVVIGIVAGAGYTATGLYRARAAEAEMRQDLVHFVNQQQVLRQRTGSLGTLEQLDGQGFRRSPGVVVEEDRLDGGGRRAYLRVRHVKTGQRCSVDYSPFVSNALNRVQCWAGEDDPNTTENVGASEVALTTPVPSTPVDTTVSASPSPPICDPTPTLASPGDQNLRPGQPGTGVFTLTNPGARSRSFSLAFSSSNASVIPVATGPASVTLPAGGSQTVTASFQLDPNAEAGQVSVLPLEANDDPCPALSGFFSVATELVLGPLELSDPADVTVTPGDRIPVRWTSRSHTNMRRMMVLAATEQAGLSRAPSAELGSHPYARGVPRTTDLEYVLDPATDGFESRDACMSFSDAEARTLPPARQCFRVTARFLPGIPSISAPTARDAGQDEQFTSEWSVVNSSNARRDFNIRAEATTDLQVVRAQGTGAAVSIPRGGSHRVQVTYRLKRPSLAGTESRGRLLVADVDPQYVPPSSNIADFVVRTKLEVCAPSVVAAPAERTERPGASFSVVWQLQNCTNAQRDLTLATDGDTDVLADGAPRTESFAPFEVRSVTLPYRMKDRSVHLTRSRPTLQATDATFGTPSIFAVTTALELCAPALAGPAGVLAQPQAPGTVTTVTYTIENCANAPRTFSAPVSSSNPAAVPDPGDPANQTIPAYGSAAVSFTYGIPANAYGGVPSDLAIRVEDTGDASLIASGGFRVTPRIIRAAPLLSAFPSQTLLPGQSGSGSAVLTSQSNVAVSYCFTATVSAGSAAAGSVVSPSPSPAACVEISTPFGTAGVTQAVSVAAAAEHPWTNQVTVTAVDQAASLTAAQTFTVTAGLQLANPTLRVPLLPLRWVVGQTRPIDYPVSNQSNTDRTLCLTVVPANSALAVVTPPPLCTKVGARQTHMFTHSMRADMASALTVVVTTYDQLAPEFQAQGRFNNELQDATPTAAWTTPGSVYMRKWFDLDARNSSSPIGRAITKYIWSWGVNSMRWDGNRFVPGGTGVAADELSTSSVRRAYDTTGVFRVCLKVVDEDGRMSRENCQDVRALKTTRARLKWRYRGWWYDPRDFCWDVPWDNQCPKESGNARWEVLLDESVGDVPIVRAWAEFQVEFWQTDDKFERKFSYSGNGDQIAPYRYDSRNGPSTYDFFSNDQKSSGSVQRGVWRVLTTEGSSAGGWPQSPNLAQHPLVLNANLGSATGAFDGGPHWVPDEAWVTLYVLDANGQTTFQSGFYDHTRSEWRGSDCINGTGPLFFACTRGFERLVPPPSAPTGAIAVEVIDGTHRLTGSGESVDGRIVDMFWEVYVQPLDITSGPGVSYQSRSTVLELSPEQCASQDVTLYLVDDRGQVGAAYHSILSSGSYLDCMGSSGPGGPQRPL
jgi:type II secretory pathway pseudopilin PulG